MAGEGVEYEVEVEVEPDGFCDECCGIFWHARWCTQRADAND